MYENAIAWMIGRADDRARERAQRELERMVASGASFKQARPSRVRAFAERLARITDRPATEVACCPA